MSLTRKIAHNTLLQLASRIVTVVLGVVTVGIMARALGQTGFGEYSTIVAFLQFFGIIVDFGLQLSMVNLMSNPNYDEGKIFNNVFTLRIVSAVIFFILAPIVVLAFPYAAAVKIGVLILTVNYVALALNQILLGLFQKKLRMDKVAISEIVGKILLLVGVVWAVQSGYGLFGILWAIVASTLIQVILAYIFSLQFNKFKFSFDKQLWKLIFKDSWPIAISIIFNLVYFKADTLVLSLTRSQAEVGIYSAPYRALEILITFPYLFVGIIFPILAHAWASQNIERYKEFFQKGFDVLVMLAVPLVVGTLPLAERLMVLIAGPEFAISGIVLQIIIFATAIIFVNVIFGYSIVILGRQKQLIWGYIFTAAIALTLYIIYIPQYSYIAAAYITVLAELIIFVINLVVATYTSKFVPRLKMFWLSLIASGGMYLVIAQTITLNLAIIVTLALITYFILLYVLGGIKKETILEIISLKS